MEEPVAMTMEQVITNITSLVTAMIQWMTSIVTAITSNPLLLAFVLVAFIGIGITAFKRLAR